MDTISCITKGVKKYIQTLYAFSNKQGLNATYTILDGIWSYLKYGCVLNQYVDGCFYKRKYFERKNMLTYKNVGVILLSVIIILTIQKYCKIR